MDAGPECYTRIPKTMNIAGQALEHALVLLSDFSPKTYSQNNIYLMEQVCKKKTMVICRRNAIHTGACLFSGHFPKGKVYQLFLAILLKS